MKAFPIPSKPFREGEQPRSTDAHYADIHVPAARLAADGYVYDGTKVYEWTSRDGLISASIRRSSKGWWILYVA